MGLLSTRERMLATIAGVSAHYLERGDVARVLMVSMAAQINPLLLGPPGTAKSAIVASLTAHVSDGIYSEVLMTPFTTLDELAGMPSIAAMRDKDLFVRNHWGTPAASHVFFADETYRGSSAALNALLKMINEHTFAGQPIPMRMCVGATNMLPSDDGLDAIDDRFLLRMYVDSIQEAANFDAYLVMAADPKRTLYEPKPEHMITLADWAQATADTRKVGLPAPVRGEIAKLREKCRSAKIYVSDRRWGQLVRVLQTSAWLDGLADVEVDHLEILRHGLWRKLEDKPAIDSMIATLDSGDVTWMSTQADVVLRMIRDWKVLSPQEKSKQASAIAQARQTAKDAIAGKMASTSRRAKEKGALKIGEIDNAYAPVQAELMRLIMA